MRRLCFLYTQPPGILKTARHNMNAHRSLLGFLDLAGCAQRCDHSQQRGEDAMPDYRAEEIVIVGCLHDRESPQVGIFLYSRWTIWVLVKFGGTIT